MQKTQSFVLSILDSALNLRMRLPSLARLFIAPAMLALVACGGVESGGPPVQVVGNDPGNTPGTDPGTDPAPPSDPDPAPSPNPPAPPSGDTTKPTVSITSPKTNTTVSGTATASANAADNVAVQGVQFKINGTNAGGEDTVAPYSVTLDTTQVANGIYSLVAVARDAAGNTTTSATIAVTVSNLAQSPADTSAPSVPVGLTATPTASFQINLAWTSSSDNVGVSGYKIYRDGAQVATTSQSFVSISGLQAQTSYSFQVAAYDAAGNTSSKSAAASATTLAANVGTSLADLAARLKPGEWGELATNGFNYDAVLSTSRSPNSIFAYSDDAVWDTVGRQFLFYGSGHGDPIGRFIRYSDATNSWSTLSDSGRAASISNHAYDHHALDSANRILYRRMVDSRMVERYDIAAGTWGRLVDIPYSLGSVAGALEFFPEMGALIYIQGRGGDGANLGQIYIYDVATAKWTFKQNNVPMGEIHNFAEYNPVHKLVIFGGGEGSSDVHKMDATGKVTKMKNAPVQMGITFTTVTVDPVSGKFLVFAKDGRTFEYDVVADVWTQKGLHNLLNTYSDLDVTATPVANYGVVMLVKSDFNQSKVLVYKHSN
jgi:hypothetical protein